MTLDPALIVYHVDGATAIDMDAASSPNTAVYYWLDGTDKLTNRQHLEYINSLGVYTIDVDNTIKYLAGLVENDEAYNSTEDVESIIGTTLNLGGLSNVEITNPQEGDHIEFQFVGGKFVNVNMPREQHVRANDLWSVYMREGVWTAIDSLDITTNNLDTHDYKVEFNFLAEVTNNSRTIRLGVFVDNYLYEDISQYIRFDQGYDDKSITIIDVIENVAPGTRIRLAAQRPHGYSGTTFRVHRRTMFLNEFID